MTSFKPARVLFVGAHIDDNESGAGGFLTKLMNNNIDRSMLIFSDCEDQPGNEGITKEFKECMRFFKIEDYNLLNMPNTRLPERSHDIRETLDKCKKEKNPDLVVTSSLNSIHQDHFIVAKECERVFRNTSLISYEDIKSTPYFSPKLFIPLTEQEMKTKLKALSFYKTQFRRYYYKLDVYRSLARTRGTQIGEKYAEAYEIVRIKLY